MEEPNEMFYREVYLNQLHVQCWRDLTINTGAAQSTLQDIKLPDSVGGIVYSDQTNPLTRNRFIYWRSRHDVLELVEHSLDAALQGNCLRLRFQDTPVLEGVTITEQPQGLHLLVATVGSVHHICFQHPTTMHQQNRVGGEQRWASVFQDVTLQTLRECGNYYAINSSPTQPAGQSLAHVASSMLLSDTQAIFALGYNSSSIVLVILDFNEVPITRIIQVSSHHLWPKFTGFLRSSKGSDGEIPVSLSFHRFRPGGEVFVVSLCCDHRLRMWNSHTGQCILSEDVMELTVKTYTPLQFGGQRHMMRKMSGLEERSTLFLAAYLCFADRRQVCVVRIREENNGNHSFYRYSTIPIPEYDVLDLRLTTDAVWILSLNTVSETCVQHCYLGETEFHQAALEIPQEEELMQAADLQDPREVALSTIFNGFFSAATILKAINIFRNNADGSTPVSVDALREEACKAVEMEIQSRATVDDLTVDDYLHLSHDCWARFYRGCVEYQRMETCPVGLVVHEESGLAAIIRKQTVSFLRPMDVLEMFQFVPDLKVELLYDVAPFNEEPALLTDLSILLEAMKELSRFVSDEDIVALNSSMFELKSPDIEGQIIIANMTNRQDSLNVSGADGDMKSLLEKIGNYLSKIRDLGASLKLLIHYLSLEAYAEQQIVEDVQQPLSAKLFAGPTGASFIANSIQQIAEERFEVCRDLLLLEIFLCSFCSELGVSIEVANYISSTLQTETVIFLQAYFALVWLTRAPVYSGTGDHGIGLLSIRSGDSSPCPRRLVETFISSSGCASARAHWTSAGKLPLDSAHTWRDVLSPLLQLTTHLLWPINRDCKLLRFMLQAGHHVQLQQYVRLLAKWCEWNGATRQYLVGMSLLNCGEAEKAFKWLICAGKGIVKEDAYLVEQVMRADPSDYGRLVTLYYLHLVPVLERYGQDQLIVELCDTAMTEVSNDDQALHSIRVFKLKSCLNLSRWQDAYSVLAKINDPSGRQDCLRRLLGGLCDKKQFQTLVTLPFEADDAAMLRDAENILEALARSGDLLTHQYYDLLYAFHIHRGSFRKASSVMYEHATRLGLEVFGEDGLRKQSNCYLAALNALKLVSSKYQWLVKPLMGSVPDDMDARSPKRNSDGEELHRGVQKREVEVVEIGEIKKEYSLVKALLKLAGSDRTTYTFLGEVLTPSEVAELLSVNGFYDEAVRICSDFSLSYSPVLEALASQYVMMSRKAASGQLTSENWAWMTDNDFKEVAQCDPAPMCLRYLFQMLHKLEKPSSTCLHRAVTVKWLQLGEHLPTQLLVSYKKRDVSELLRVYVQFGMMLDAAELIIEYVKAVMGLGPRAPQDFSLKNTLHATNKGPHVILPYTYIDIVFDALQDNLEEHPDYVKAHEELSKTMDQYLNEAEKVSRDMIDLASMV